MALPYEYRCGLSDPSDTLNSGVKRKASPRLSTMNPPSRISQDEPSPSAKEDLILEERIKRELHPLDAYEQLVENAIDSGATHIEIVVTDGGFRVSVVEQKAPPVIGIIGRR